MRLPDHLLTGLFAGLMLPVIALALLYQLEFANFSPEQFIRQLRAFDLLAAVVALILIPNFLVFFLFLRKEWNESARGMVGITLLWVIGYLLQGFM